MSLIQIERDALLAALRPVNRVVDARQQIPVLTHVLLEFCEDRLLITGTDLSMQLTAAVEMLSTTGVVTITAPAQKLVDVLAHLPTDVVVDIQVEGALLKIESAETKFRLQTLPATTFPKMPAISENAMGVTLAERELKRVLAVTHSAMADDDARSYLKGALLVVRDGDLNVAATDMYRLALASCPLAQDLSEIHVVLPRKPAIELSKVLSDTDEPVTLRIMENLVAFAFDDLELTTAVLDNRFPNYQNVIPDKWNATICVNRLKLQRALQRVAVLVKDKFPAVRWTLAEGRLRIEAANADHEAAEDLVLVDYCGEHIDLGFNIRFLMDALSSIDSDEIECGFCGNAMQLSVPDRADVKYLINSMRI